MILDGPTLFDSGQATPPQRSRRSDPATSKIAGVMATDFIGEHHRRILAALNRPGTSHEIAHRSGLDPVAVNRRLVELRRSNLITPTGNMRMSPSGRPCREWRRA